MDTRWPIVVGITAICGGIAWFAIRKPATPPATSQGSGTLTAPSGSGRAAIGAPLPPVLHAGGINALESPRPALPDQGSAAPDPGPQPPSADETFAAQDRDAAWAPKTESEIKRRLGNIRGAHLDRAECRQDQCLLVIAGTQAELSKTLAAIDEPGGLHGFAENILLTGPEEKDGKLVLRAYAKFAR
jgi:hypothetical protein